MNEPTIGVVVVNYNGGELTIECLRSVLRTRWPANRLRVVLVDNASHDGVVARVRDELPVVLVVEQGENRGFGAACNAGIRALTDVDFVALVNNDATVDPGWLAPLVEVLVTDAEAGAACPKILFAGRFWDVELRSATAPRGLLDRRDLGVFVAGARVDGEDVWSRVQLVDGTWGLEPDAVEGGQWTAATAHLRVPAPADGRAATVSLLLSADTPRAVALRAGDATVEHRVGTEPAWYDTTARGNGIPVVNNAGVEMLPSGFAADRGYLEPDDGRYDTPTDVFAWCGAAVLLRRAYLDDVGLFDESFFLYYEDLELAWRGAERGWRHRVVPDAVVHHVHAAATGRGSAVQQYYDERNRLRVLARHGAPRAAAGAALRSLLVTASYARRDIVAPLLRGAPPHGELVTRRLRAWLGAAGAIARLRRPSVQPPAAARSRS